MILEVSFSSSSIRSVNSLYFVSPSSPAASATSRMIFRMSLSSFSSGPIFSTIFTAVSGVMVLVRMLYSAETPSTLSVPVSFSTSSTQSTASLI